MIIFSVTSLLRFFVADGLLLVGERESTVDACQQTNVSLRRCTWWARVIAAPPMDGGGSTRPLRDADRDSSIAVDQVVEVGQWWTIPAHPQRCRCEMGMSSSAL
jgi:hypothetical protein